MDTQRMIQVSKIAERFWLIIIALCIGASSWLIFQNGWENQKQTLVLPVLAILWYGFRRHVRKKLERQS